MRVFVFPVLAVQTGSDERNHHPNMFDAPSLKNGTFIAKLDGARRTFSAAYTIAMADGETL